jgi:hypothetical protein
MSGIISETTIKINQTNSTKFCIIRKDILGDSRLSSKAKGIICTLQLFEDESLTPEKICSLFSDEKSSILDGLKELIKFGYVDKNISVDHNSNTRKIELLVKDKNDEKKSSEPDGIQKEVINNLYTGYTQTYPQASQKNDVSRTLYDSLDNFGSNNYKKQQQLDKLTVLHPLPVVVEIDFGIFNELSALGISEELLNYHFPRHGNEKMKKALKMLKEAISAKTDIRSRGGWLKSCLERNWSQESASKIVRHTPSEEETKLLLQNIYSGKVADKDSGRAYMEKIRGVVGMIKIN